jgi:hypothetical protein
MVPQKKMNEVKDSTQILALDTRNQSSEDTIVKNRNSRFSKKKVSSRTRTTQKLEMKRNTKPATKKLKGHFYQSSSFGSLNTLHP